MNSIKIYDIKTDNDNIKLLVDKLKSVGADIDIYNTLLETDKLDENIKLKRLLNAYGNSILPVTMVNGEIVKVEGYLEPMQIIAQTELSMNKIAKAGIELNQNLCDTKGGCGNCSCSKTNCGSCSSKNQCHKNKTQE